MTIDGRTWSRWVENGHRPSSPLLSSPLFSLSLPPRSRRNDYRVNSVHYRDGPRTTDPHLRGFRFRRSALGDLGRAGPAIFFVCTLNCALDSRGDASRPVIVPITITILFRERRGTDPRAFLPGLVFQLLLFEAQCASSACARVWTILKALYIYIYIYFFFYINFENALENLHVHVF